MWQMQKFLQHKTRLNVILIMKCFIQFFMFGKSENARKTWTGELDFAFLDEGKTYSNFSRCIKV